MRDVILPSGIERPPSFFKQLGQQFGVTIWRSWLNDQRLEEFDLNSRQNAAVRHLRSHRRITNSEYQGLFDVAKRTASKDLGHLVSLNLIEKVGTTGKGVYYRIGKGAPNGHMGHGFD